MAALNSGSRSSSSSCSVKFLAIVAEVSKSPTFQIESPRARAALECAKYMQFLLESTDGELKVLSTFCDQLYASLEKLCTNVQTSRFSFSTQRIKLMTLFHQKYPRQQRSDDIHSANAYFEPSARNAKRASNRKRDVTLIYVM